MDALKEVVHGAPALFDGALGTMLIGAGLAPGQPGEGFTLDRPEVLRDVHRRYAEAGSRVVSTNTFNSNRVRLEHAGLVEHLEECNRRGVELARQSVPAGVAVAGSMGPTGVLLAPLGEMAPERAVEVFAEQATILDRSGVDFLLLETMYDVEEALAAVRACRQVSGKPVAATMTFAETPRGFCTMMGQAATEALPRLAEAGAGAVGANCTLGSAAMLRLAAEIRRAVSVPVLIQANAGQPEAGAGGGPPRYPETPEFFAEHAGRLAELGIELIGGCCGTTPEFIAAARQKLAGGRRGG